MHLPPSPRGALFALASFALVGCSPGYLAENSSEPQNAADAVRLADLTPKAPKPAPPGSSSALGFQGFSVFGSSAAQPGVVPAGGSPDDANDPAGSLSPGGGDGITLNFESTPVASVAKVVLGDTLGLNYVLDPRAQGSISLSTGRPIPKKSLLFVLESALRANNLAMVREGGGYRIGPANEGSIGPIDRGGGVAAGFGMTVFPLRYASSATISRLLEGFAARPGALRADPSGTLLIVTGSSAERETAMETVRSFDVDWMRGQSVGLYPVRNSAPEPIVAALEKIMDSGENGLGKGLVKLQAIARQNAILVVSARPDMLRQAERWIQRLDSPNSAALSVHVYKVRYGESKLIAQLLNAMFGAGGGASVDAASNQLAPSSGEKALSVTERLTGGRTTNNAQPGPDAGQSLGAAPQGGQAGGGVFGGLQTAALANAMNGGAQGGDTGLPAVRITADAANNSVLVYANSETYKTIERALIQLDRPKSQVAIEATIAEVDLNDNLNYGVQFYLNNHIASVGNTATGQPLASTDAGSGFNIVVGNNATPRAIINALHAVTDVRILSNPSLVVQDNQEATLEVGDQVPVSTGSATVLTTSNTIVNTVEYKNTGIILHVLPRISPDNTVSLAIDQEISSVPNNTDPTLTPTISERKVKSAVSVVSGQMVLLAGLIADEQDRSRSGVPGLSQLPFVGGAFGTTGKSTKRKELIILIRPQVIRSGEDASEVAEQLRAKMRAGRNPAFSAPDALNINTRRY